MTETPISFEWHEPTRATIHRGGQAWARLTRENHWTVYPLIPDSNGGLANLTLGNPIPLDLPGLTTREDACVAALVAISRPDFRPPPAFAKDAAVWEHVKAKNPKPYDEWEPKDFAAANKIYGYAIRKYGAGNPTLAARYGVALV